MEGLVSLASEACANYSSKNASSKHVSAPRNKVHRGTTLSGQDSLIGFDSVCKKYPYVCVQYLRARRLAERMATYRRRV